MSLSDRYGVDPYYLSPREQKLADELAVLQDQIAEARAVSSKLTAIMSALEECITTLEGMGGNGCGQ